MRIIPGTAELFGEYYGQLPFAVPTMRAFFLEIDGELRGICGFVRRGPRDMFVFTEGKGDVFDKHKLSVMKFAKAMVKLADENGWVLTTLRDEARMTSGTFLAALGFEPLDNGEYIRWVA